MLVNNKRLQFTTCWTIPGCVWPSRGVASSRDVARCRGRPTGGQRGREARENGRVFHLFFFPSQSVVLKCINLSIFFRRCSVTSLSWGIMGWGFCLCNRCMVGMQLCFSDQLLNVLTNDGVVCRPFAVGNQLDRFIR